jgi:hypothetical protein
MYCAEESSPGNSEGTRVLGKAYVNLKRAIVDFVCIVVFYGGG